MAFINLVLSNLIGLFKLVMVQMYLIVSCTCVIYLISKCFFLTVDFSRVVLKTVEGVEGSDYINASYIDVR